MLTLGGLYFFLLIILVLYLPGRFLLRFSKLMIFDQSIHVPLSLGIGSAFFIAGVYALSWIHLEFFYLLLLLPLLFFEVRYLAIHYKKTRFDLPFFELGIILIGSLLALSITGRSGLLINGQLLFYGVNSTDAIFHISLIGNLMHHFPPTHAGMAGVPIHGYNFLYDLFVASFAHFFFLSPLDLFFRYFSLFVALFYGLSALALARFLNMSRVATRFFLFLVYFAQGTIFIFQYFHILYDPGIVQPIANIVDPSVLFSVSFLFLSFILIFSMKRKVHILLTAVVIAIIPMIKIYTAFLLFGALGIVVIFAFIQNKKEKWYFLSLMLLAGILGGSIYAPINLGVGKLIFTPFLLYSHFLESYAPLNHSDWWLRMLVYFEHKNYLRIVQNYLILLALFFIPSLSLRLFGLVSVGNIFKRSFYSLQNIFLVSAVLLGILIPSFFIQNIAVFVIIQFLWITYFLLLIPASYGFSSLYTISPRLVKITLLIFVIGISLPDLFSLVTQYSHDPVVIPAAQVALTKEVKNKILQSDGVVVLNIHQVGESLQVDSFIPIISAMSEHDVYYEPEVLEFSGLDQEVAKRKALIAKIDRTLEICSGEEINGIPSLLKEAKSKYILTLKDKPCLQTLPTFTLMSRKGEAALYKLR